MSRGDLQEMEVKTQQSKTAVNAGAALAFTAVLDCFVPTSISCKSPLDI